MFTKDESSLERYITYSIVLPPLNGEKWLEYLYKIINRVFEINKDILDPLELKYLETSSITLLLFDLLETILNTPRKIKLMGRHLDQKLKTPANSIFIYDLILLSSIQAGNPKLFSWISQNRRILIEPKFIGSAGWATGNRKKIKMKEEDRAKEIREALGKEKGISNDEKDVVISLFIDPTPEGYFTDEYRAAERRVRKDLYFQNYFIRDKLPKIGTVQGQNLIRDTLDYPLNAIDETYKLLLNDWNDDTRADIRELIIINTSYLIDKLERPQSYKLLVALGRLVKNLDDAGMGRDIASVSVWSYTERKLNGSDEMLDFITNILNEDVSHKYFSILVFYLFTKDEKRRKNPHFLSETQLIEVKYLFDKKCVDIFYDEGYNPRDLLDRNVTDAPLDMISRWHQVQSEGHHSTYLLRFIENYPGRANEFIEKVKEGFHKQGDIEELIPRESWAIFNENIGILNGLTEASKKFIKSVLTGTYLSSFMSGNFDT